MRYYSSTAGAMSLTVGVNATDLVLSVNSVVGLPVSFPYTLVIEPGVAGQEEIVTVTAAAGLNLTVTRGSDGTSGVAHDLGSTVRHMMTARDLRESREHEAATGAHGTTGDVVGTSDAQVLDRKTFQSTDGSTAPLTIKAQAGQTANVWEVRGSTGTLTWYVDSSTGQLRCDTVILRNSGGANLFGRVAELLPPSGKDGVVVNHTTGTTGYAWKSQKAGVNKALIDLDGNATFAALTATTGTFSGAITSPTITALSNADTALGGRVTAIESNLGSQTTFAATSASKDGKRTHWGRVNVTPNATGYATVAHGAGFTPTVVTASPEQAYFCGVDPANFTSTSFVVRLLTPSGGPAVGTYSVSFFCGE